MAGHPTYINVALERIARQLPLGPAAGAEFTSDRWARTVRDFHRGALFVDDIHLALFCRLELLLVAVGAEEIRLRASFRSLTDYELRCSSAWNLGAVGQAHRWINIVHESGEKLYRPFAGVAGPTRGQRFVLPARETHSVEFAATPESHGTWGLCDASLRPGQLYSIQADFMGLLSNPVRWLVPEQET